MSDSEKNFDMNSEQFSNQYKEELNNIHAPEDLIMKTLARVREEENKVQAEKAAETPNYIDSTYSNNSGSIYGAGNQNRYNYVGETDQSGYSQQSTNSQKVSFFSKYKKPIATFATVLAAAAVLIFAMMAGVFGGRQMSDSATSSETTQSADSAASSASSSATADDRAESTTEAAADYEAEEGAEDRGDMSAETAASDSYDDAEETEKSNSYSADHKKKNDMDISLLGGWKTSDSIEVTSELKTVFDSAAEDMDDLTPVAYLGSQMVSGVNHVFLCKWETDDGAKWSLVYIYEDLDGKCKLTKVDALDIAASSDASIVKSGSSTSGVGGWNFAETNDIDSDLEKVINMAVEGEDGVSFEPVMVLNTQVVAGTNYAVLCKNTVTESNATYWTVLYVYRDLDNEGEMLNNALLVFGE